MIKQNKLILAGFLLFFIGVLLHAIYSCQSAINQKMEQVDHDLLTGAMAAASIVPDKFNVHVQPGNINDDEFLDVLKRLSSYADTAGLDYIYTMTLVDGSVHYTSCSAAAQDLPEDYAVYFEAYDDASEDLLRSLSTGKITYETYADSEGTFRSVFIPMNASDGTRYITGADIDISNLQLLRRQNYIQSMLECVYYLFILVPLGIIIIKNTRSQKEFLNAEIARKTNDIRTLNQELEKRMAEVDLAAQKSQRAMDNALEAKNEAEARQEKIVETAGLLEGIVRRVVGAANILSANMSNAVSGSRVQFERSTEAATSIEEMNATILEIAHNVDMVATTADEARKGVEDGAGVVDAVGKAVEEVAQHSKQMKLSLNELGNKAEGITHIMDVISDIADQTNLLALNAAIEAARAGDAGRGFAVVADEVRKLAEKTMDATHEVGQVVTAIQQASQANIRSMEHSTKTVGKSTELAIAAGESLQSIVELIETTADQVRNIATASEQQTAASEQISRGAEEIKNIAEETESSMTVSAQSVAELTKLANELQTLIEKLLQV